MKNILVLFLILALACYADLNSQIVQLSPSNTTKEFLSKPNDEIIAKLALNTQSIAAWPEKKLTSYTNSAGIKTVYHRVESKYVKKDATLIMHVEYYVFEDVAAAQRGVTNFLSNASAGFIKGNYGSEPLAGDDVLKANNMMLLVRKGKFVVVLSAIKTKAFDDSKNSFSPVIMDDWAKEMLENYNSSSLSN